MSRRQQRPISPIEQLQQFRKTAERLREAQLVKQGFETQSVIRWDNTGEAPAGEVSMAEPLDDILTGLLGIFRQFINNDEPIHMDKIFNTLNLYLTDDLLRGELVKARAHWNLILRQDRMRVIIEGKELSPRFITDMWINDALHGQIKEDKAVILKYMDDPLAKALVRPRFFACISNAIHVIAYVHFVVNKALEQNLIDLSRTK